MTNTIVLDHLKESLFEALTETFEAVHGMYLDKGTSLFETLATISAEEASRPVEQHCATIAAQVAHTRFYLDILEQYMLNQKPGKVDWDEIWRTVGAVTPEEWEASKNQLNASYQRIVALMKNFDRWEGENDISASMSVIVHSAYHLGEIRQAMCTVKQS